MIEKCGTCNREVTSNFVEFKCPKCLKSRIIRCNICKKNTKGYTCSECGFTGP